jgi:hypothetical protein
MGKHTPGPWRVVRIGTLSFVAQDADEEGRFAIASVAFPNYHPEGLAAARREQADNSLLIAAAPDLLAALRGMLSIHDSVTLGQEREFREQWVPIARAAIAKAEGRP